MNSPSPIVRLLCLAIAFVLVAIAMTSGMMLNLASREGEKAALLLKGDEASIQAGIDRLASLPEAKAKLHVLTGLSAGQQRTREELSALTRQWAALTGLLSLIGLALMWPLFRALAWRSPSSWPAR